VLPAKDNELLFAHKMHSCIIFAQHLYEPIIHCTSDAVFFVAASRLDEHWTIVEPQDSPTVPAPSAAQVALATIARNRAVHASRTRHARARILAERVLALVAFLWDSEFGDQFDVCPTSHFEDL